MAKLKDELKQTKAENERIKAELQLNKGIHGVLSKDDSSENLETPSSINQMTMERKSTCKDKLSNKKCKKLKKKNNGKGCQNKSTQKKCMKMCRLCPDGKYSVINYLQCWLEETLQVLFYEANVPISDGYSTV